MTKTQLLELLEKHGACDEAVSWVRESKLKTAKSIWFACRRGDWMLWLASGDVLRHLRGGAGVDRKLLATAACACARQALRYVPAGEDRPRIAIETAERWVRGEATIDEVRAAMRSAAYAAAAAADASTDASAAASTDAYAAAARKRSLARSSDLVREAIPYEAVMAAIGGNTK